MLSYRIAPKCKADGKHLDLMLHRRSGITMAGYEQRRQCQITPHALYDCLSCKNNLVLALHGSEGMPSNAHLETLREGETLTFVRFAWSIQLIMACCSRSGMLALVLEAVWSGRARPAAVLPDCQRHSGQVRSAAYMRTGFNAYLCC